MFFVGGVGVCIFLGVPIAFAFALSTFAYIWSTTTIPLSVVIGQMDQGMSSIELLAVPMFVVLGLLLEMTGIARAMVDFLAALVGHRRGGLSYVLIAAMYLISGISGSKAADQAAVAPVLLPEMRRRGVGAGELAAQLAASAAMSETIPPSLVLIIVGAVTGVSISALFTGGLLPAGLAAALLARLVFLRTRHDTPEPAPSGQARRAGRLFVAAIPALILPFVIRYAVLAGVTTATEVATVGVAYSVIGGPRGVSLLRLAAGGADPGGDGGAERRDPADHRRGERHGLGADAGGVRADAGGADDRPARRARRVHGGVDRAVRRCWAACWRGCRPWCCSARCCSPWRSSSASTRCSTRSWRSWRWAIGLFSPPFGVGFYQTCLISRVSSDEAFGRIWPYMAAIAVALVVVALVPWLSVGFL